MLVEFVSDCLGSEAGAGAGMATLKDRTKLERRQHTEPPCILCRTSSCCEITVNYFTK